VNAKKLLISAAPRQLAELTESLPQMPCPIASNPRTNHKDGMTQVHFAGSLRQLCHIPNPMKDAQMMLRAVSFQSTADIVCGGIAFLKPVSRTAVPITATKTLRSRSPKNRSEAENIR
jgi:hypothetical protein